MLIKQPYKQIIAVREDIKISSGKLCVQCCHASIGAYKKCSKKIVKRWENQGAKKVILKIKDKEELIKIQKKAEKLKIPNFLVVDAGLTEFSKPTITALGIGPADDKRIDRITGKLKLL